MVPWPNEPRRAKTATYHKKALSVPTDSLVVYIHGIGRKPKPDALKLEWDLALFGRDMGDRTRMAYWADLVHDGYEETAVGTRSTDRRVDVDSVLAAAGVRGDRARAFGYEMAALGVTTWAEVPGLTGEREKILVGAGVAADPGDAVLEEAAGKELVDDLGDDRTPVTVGGGEAAAARAAMLPPRCGYGHHGGERSRGVDRRNGHGTIFLRGPGSDVRKIYKPSAPPHHRGAVIAPRRPEPPASPAARRLARTDGRLRGPSPCHP